MKNYKVKYIQNRSGVDLSNEIESFISQSSVYNVKNITINSLQGAGHFAFIEYSAVDDEFEEFLSNNEI